jgi:hypothetical protein
MLSCSSERSLQVFIVDQQEKSDIISADFQTSMLSLDEKVANEEDLKTLKALKKVSLIGYQIKEGEEARYKAEVSELKNILKQDKYGELMRIGSGKKGARVYVVGEEDKVDEIIIFGADNTKGWLLIRILGKDMDPGKMMQVAQKIDINASNIDFSQLENLDLNF